MLNYQRVHGGTWMEKPSKCVYHFYLFQHGQLQGGARQLAARRRGLPAGPARGRDEGCGKNGLHMAKWVKRMDG